MMLPDLAPIKTRELVWHLPELLEGRDPVLERPQVVEYLKTDAEARATLLAVAEVARTLIAGTERRPRLPRRTIIQMSRPVETAVRYFKTQMVELLFKVGLDQFERATWEMGFAYDSHAQRSPSRLRGDLSTVPQRLMDSLGLTSRSLGEHEDHVNRMTGLLGKKGDRQLEHVLELMKAGDALIPGLQDVRFYLLEIPVLAGESAEAKVWLEFARTAGGGSLAQAAGLYRLSGTLLAKGAYRDAGQAIESAVLLGPQSMSTLLVSALCGALTGDSRLLERRLASWLEWASRSERCQQMGMFQIQEHGRHWKVACSVIPRRMDEIFDLAPPKIAEAFRGVMQ
ncbi:MAG: hypothetical protein V2A76_03760 [Planctomycetota bacterium]